MTIEIIDTAFRKMISERGSYRRMGISINYSAQLRYKTKKGITISIDLKLRLLQRTGWIPPDSRYTRREMVGAVRFCLSQGLAARDLGAEYLVDKFLSTTEGQ
jgi:hypothetical protein